MASSVQRLAALHREMVQVRISAQVTVTRDNTRQITEEDHTNTQALSQSARTILDVRNVALYSHHRAPDAGHDLEVASLVLADHASCAASVLYSLH